MTPTQAEAQIRAVSLRATAPRIAVLHELESHPHADVDTLVRAVRVRLGKVSTQAVYDILAALTEAGLVRRIEPAGHPARYETRTADNHHHVVCRACGAIGDVDCSPGQAPCLTPTDSHGFVIDEAEVTYWGLCPACTSESAVTEPSSHPTKEK
ncbi:Fur family transcriptional regulator [Dermacoccaceae bacterium W4C1]